MKNMRWMGCLLMAMAGPLMATEERVVHLQDVGIEGFANGSIVECPEGTSLPLKMVLKGQFLALESEAMLHILKTCYVQRDAEEQFLFSTDLQTWKNFADFFTGDLKVFVDSQAASVELELNQK